MMAARAGAMHRPVLRKNASLICMASISPAPAALGPRRSGVLDSPVSRCACGLRSTMGADDRPAGVSHERNQSNEAVAREEGGVAVAASATPAAGAVRIAGSAEAVRLVAYEDERQLSDIMSLVDRDLSEPYSIFTYRYFLHNWPGLCFVAKAGERTVGSIVCKAERELEDDPLTGYIAMLAVDTTFRKHGIGTALASKAIEAMRDMGCEEVVLETEVTNGGALNLYTKLGFSKNERLIKYYLNGVDAFRLKLWFR